jgi:protein SCO1/2
MIAIVLAGAVATARANPVGLVDQAGRVFSEASLQEEWHLVYFGYTHCPDICPTSLFEMTVAIDLLAPAERERITPVFVTLDPARDTPDVMARYVEPLGHGLVAVSGSEEAVTSLAFRHGIVAVRNVQQGKNYTVDHTSSVLLIGPGGKEVERFPYSMDFNDVAKSIQAHMTAPPPAAAPGK